MTDYNGWTNKATMNEKEIQDMAKQVAEKYTSEQINTMKLELIGLCPNETPEQIEARPSYRILALADRLRAGRVFMPLTWRAVTIDGEFWAFRREHADGRYYQFKADYRTMKRRFYHDTMQYFAPIERNQE